MGKGVHSKVHKRKSAVKIRYMEEHIAPARYQQIHQNILLTIRGTEQKKQEKVNAFLYPSHPNAEFPQYQMPDMTDLRSTNIQFAGKEYRGAYRKRNTALIKEKEKQQQQQEQIAKIEAESDCDINYNEENNNADELISGLEKIKIGKKKVNSKSEIMVEEKSKGINKSKFRQGACRRSKNQMNVFSRYKGNKRRK